MKKLFKYSFFAILLSAFALLLCSCLPAAAAIGTGLAVMPFGLNVSPSQKIQDVASKFGLNNLKRNQGTSRIIYDTLPIVAGQEYYYFFKECNTRQFPMTNMGKGNKLEVGEALTLLWGYLSIWTKDITSPTAPIYDTDIIDTFPKILLGEWSFQLGNKTICKPIRLLEWGSEHSKSAQHENNCLYTFNSILTIIPLMEFEAITRIIPFTAADFKPNVDIYMSLTLEGLGSILAPEETF